ncbi:MAG: alpha/beta hydrolase [Candidatus Dojkabacteria bacterium]
MHQDLKLKVAGQELFGVIENPGQKAVVILAHGYTGNMNGPQDIYVKLSRRLQEEGYSVIRFNFRGTSPSEGNQEDMTLAGEVKDLKTIIGHAKKERYKRIILVGESFAGAVLAKAYTEKVDMMVFWYPLFELRDCLFRDFINVRSEEKLKKEGFVEIEEFRVGPKLYKEIVDVDVYDLLKKVYVPTLLLHGDSDKDVPYQQSEKAFELLPGIKELGLLQGADHSFRHEQDEVIAKTVKFIQDELPTEG